MNAVKKNAFKILLISHHSADYSFLSKTLSNSQDKSVQFRLECTSNLKDGITRLEEDDIHIVLLDLPLPDYNRLDAFLELYQKFPTLPIVILTNLHDDALAVESVIAGAQDYLVKSKINEGVIVRVVRYAIERNRVEMQMRRELKETIDLTREAQYAAEMRSKFLAYLSHEIRVPMNAVLGFSNLLKQTKLTDKQRDYLDTIASSGTLILNIINDVLDFSKIESGNMVLERIDFHIGRLIEEVFKIVKTVLGEKRLYLDYRVTHPVPLLLNGDPYRLKQVLINLLSNAIKFTPEGSVSLSVSLDETGNQNLKNDECLLHFVVKDSGIGIPLSKQSKIFETFTQADTSITRKYGGTGLGLAISKRLVESMDGVIWVKSQEGHGSEFHFTAKFKTGTSDLDQTDPRNLELIDHRSNDSLQCQGVKILVAEDSGSSQELMREYFKMFECEGDFVTDGYAAIEKIRNNSYDLCLMDVEMPGLDGLAATKKIRRELSVDLPIIALTASAMKEDQEKCIKAGMNDYITKPIDMMLLRQKIVRYSKNKKL